MWFADNRVYIRYSVTVTTRTDTARSADTRPDTTRSVTTSPYEPSQHTNGPQHTNGYNPNRDVSTQTGLSADRSQHELAEHEPLQPEPLGYNTNRHKAQHASLPAQEKDRKLGGDIAIAFFGFGAPASLFVGWLADFVDRRRLFVAIILIGEMGALSTVFATTYSQVLTAVVDTDIGVDGCRYPISLVMDIDIRYR